MSNYIKTELQTLNTNPKMDVTTVKCLQTNKMIMTHNVRLIFTPINQTNKIFHLIQQFVKCNNSIPFNKMRLLQAKGEVFHCCNNQSDFS